MKRPPTSGWPTFGGCLTKIRRVTSRWARGFTLHFPNKLKLCALAGVHFLYGHGWEPKKVFAFRPPLAGFAQRIYGYVDSACNAGAGGSNDGTH